MTEPTRTVPPDSARPAESDSTRITAAGNAAVVVPPPSSEFVLGEEIGRGGMGIVYRARDLALDREVAVKILQDKYAPESGTAARFVAEARITGQLQHPGIPAVYQVGTWAEGRPFLAMKLIKGRTLDDLLKAEGPGPTRWLGTFEGICHALGYAHEHRVIHRDLKPANMMVGAFGEVQVMDWGLAKVLGERPQVSGPGDAKEETLAASEIRSLRESDGSFTQAGSILGTPAYMPPEQAAGEVEKIDRRADVFGLGAILCFVLTGKPPYEGETADSIRIAAMRGRTEEAFRRLDACGADPEVIGLCKRCLAFEQDERPANADAVAKEVARLRAAADDRVRKAEVDRARAEGRAAEQVKRRRTVQRYGGVVIAVLVLGVVGTALGTFEARRQRDAAEDARKASEEARQAAERAREAGANQRAAAENATLLAGRNLRLAQDAVRETFHKIGSNTLAEIPGAGPLRYDLAAAAATYTEQFLAGNPDNLNVLWDALDVYRMMGRMYGNANQPDKAWPYFEKSLALGRRLVGEGHAAIGTGGFLLTPDGRQTLTIRVRADGTWDTPPTAALNAHEYVDMHVRTLNQAAWFLRDRGRFDEARKLLDEADGPEMLGRLIAHCPQVPAYRRLQGQNHLQLAGLDLDEGRPADALARYDRLVALFRELADGPKPPVWQNRAEMFSRPETDARNFGRAVRGRALALLALGRGAEAEDALAGGIGRLEKSSNNDDQQARGVVLEARGRVRAADPARRAAALADFDAALVVLRKAHQGHEYFASLTLSLAEALVARGRVLATGEPAERQRAEADFRAARELCETLVATTEGAARPGELARWADAEAGLAAVAGDRAEARKLYAAAAAHYEQALAGCPTLADAKRGLGEARTALARFPLDVAPPPRLRPQK